MISYAGWFWNFDGAWISYLIFLLFYGAFWAFYKHISWICQTILASHALLTKDVTLQNHMVQRIGGICYFHSWYHPILIVFKLWRHPCGIHYLHPMCTCLRTIANCGALTRFDPAIDRLSVRVYFHQARVHVEYKSTCRHQHSTSDQDQWGLFLSSLLSCFSADIGSGLLEKTLTSWFCLRSSLDHRRSHQSHFGMFDNNVTSYGARNVNTSSSRSVVIASHQDSHIITYISM